MNVGRLIATVTPVRKDVPLVCPAFDHSYRPAFAYVSKAVYNTAHGTYSEYFEEVPLGENDTLIDVVVVE